MDNSDDYDFTPSSSSKLASIFNSTTLYPEESNLTYTAPKQPRTGGTSDTKSEPAATDSNVISARVVQVWKLTDGKYNTVGKLGLAIIGSSTHNSYEVILYKDKRNVIIRLKITQTFEIFLKKDDFISFYDIAKDNWLIKFNSNADCTIIVNNIQKYGGRISNHVEAEKVVTSAPPSEVQDRNVDVPSENENFGDKSKTDIFNESFERKAKGDILSRIAKMGQSILPNKTLEQDDDNASTDSSDTKISESQQFVSPTVVQVQRSIQPMPNTFVVGQPMTYEPLSLYFTENRTHNTEVRMNLTQISEKLNNIAKIVGTEKNNNSDTDVLKSKIKVLHLTKENLSRELEKVQEENRKLKKSVTQETTLIKAVEDCKLELQLVKQREEARSTQLTQEISLHKNTSEELSQRLQNLEMKLFEKDDLINQLEIKLANFERRIENDNTNKSGDFTAVLKSTMNGMYSNIMEKIQNEHSSSKINSIIAQNIKSTTLNIIQDFQNIYVTPSELS